MNQDDLARLGVRGRATVVKKWRTVLLEARGYIESQFTTQETMDLLVGIAEVLFNREEVEEPMSEPCIILTPAQQIAALQADVVRLVAERDALRSNAEELASDCRDLLAQRDAARAWIAPLEAALVEADMEPGDLTDKQLDEIEHEQVARLRQSRGGPEINGRMVLQMVREIQRARHRVLGLLGLEEWISYVNTFLERAEHVAIGDDDWDRTHEHAVFRKQVCEALRTELMKLQDEAEFGPAEQKYVGGRTS